MKLLKFIFLLLGVSCFGLQAQPQLQKLMADPNILWIGEVYRDYSDLDGTREGRSQDFQAPRTLSNGERLYAHRQSTQIIKLQRSNYAFDEWDRTFASYVFDTMTQSFADADLSKPLSLKQKKGILVSVDTVLVFNPETMAEEFMTLTNELDLSMVVSYRVRSLVYYDQKQGHYQALPLALAPLIIQRNDNNDTISLLSSPFWIPIEWSDKPINPLQAPQMPFIKSVVMDYAFQDCKVLKSTKTWQDCTQLMLDKVQAESAKRLLYASLDSEVYEPKQLDSLLNRVDTAMVFDPNTFKEVPVAIHRKIDVSIIRFNQVWAWDEKRRKLVSNTYAFCAIHDKKNDNKEIIARLPLFWLLPHKLYR